MQTQLRMSPGPEHYLIWYWEAFWNIHSREITPNKSCSAIRTLKREHISLNPSLFASHTSNNSKRQRIWWQGPLYPCPVPHTPCQQGLASWENQILSWECVQRHIKKSFLFYRKVLKWNHAWLPNLFRFLHCV